VDDVIGLDDNLKLKERHGQPGEVSPHRITKQARVWRHDRQQYELMAYTADIERNWYEQTWRTESDGAVAYHKHGFLDDPRVHGKSARQPRL
jgi:hypothetical protein